MDDEEDQMRPLTQRTMEIVDKINERIMKERNGRPFENSVRLIRRERIKRTKYLMETITGKPFPLTEEDLVDFDEDDLKELENDQL